MSAIDRFNDLQNPFFTRFSKGDENMLKELQEVTDILVDSVNGGGPGLGSFIGIACAGATLFLTEEQRMEARENGDIVDLVRVRDQEDNADSQNDAHIAYWLATGDDNALQLLVERNNWGRRHEPGFASAIWAVSNLSKNCPLFKAAIERLTITDSKN